MKVAYDNGLLNIAKQIESSIEEVVRAGADAVCESAKSLCPADTDVLRDSIDVYQEGSYAQVYADTDYAASVEFGTPQIPPKPYLVPALIANKNSIIAAMTDAIEEMGG